jgi:5-methylcytosine-specific restriction protein A
MPHKPISHAARMRALRPRAPDDRASAAARGYGHRWRKLRRLKLNDHPMCEWTGCDRAATDVDHIRPRAQGGDDSFANLQSLCHSHHSQKTASGDGGFGHQAHDDEEDDACSS